MAISGQLRCDCGDQLRGAIAKSASRGRGFVYLAGTRHRAGQQLRAYRLQDSADGGRQPAARLRSRRRVYLPAEMLRHWAIKSAAADQQSGEGRGGGAAALR
jgi:GTP cyclohydrolase II